MARPSNDSAIRRAQGNTGHRSKPRERVDPAPPPGTPECPSDIRGATRRVWDRTIQLLQQVPDLLTIVDGPTIADFCRVTVQKSEIERGMQIEAKEAERIAREKKESAHLARAKILLAYQSTLEKLRMRQNALARELGMTPSSRSQIKVRAPGYAGGVSPRPQDIEVVDPIFDSGSDGLIPV